MLVKHPYLYFSIIYLGGYGFVELLILLGTSPQPSIEGMVQLRMFLGYWVLSLCALGIGRRSVEKGVDKS